MQGKPILTWEELEAQASTVPDAAQPLLLQIIGQLRPDEGPFDGMREQAWYLRSLSVRGFVGIGALATEVAFDSRPGLTVVTARNGVGKSSLACALRHLLSGSPLLKEVDDTLNIRWRNLHSGAMSIRADFWEQHTGRTAVLIDDGSGPRFTVDGSAAQAVPKYWTQAKTKYEPVLIYPEVAQAIEDDKNVNSAWLKAMALEVLTAALDASERIQAENKSAASKLRQERKEAIASTAPSFHLLLPATNGQLTSWNAQPLRDRLHELERSAREPEQTPASVSDSLRGAVRDLTSAVERIIDIRGEAQAGQHNLRKLFEHALQHVAGDRDPCPLCGSTDRGWRQRVTDALQVIGDSDRYTRVRERFEQAQTFLLDTVPSGLPTNLATLSNLHGQAADLDQMWSAIRERIKALTVHDVSTAEVADLADQIADAATLHEDLVRAVAAAHASASYENVATRERLGQFLTAWEEHHEAESRNAAAAKLSAWLRNEIKIARNSRAAELGAAAIRHFTSLCPDGGAVLQNYQPSGGVSRQQRMQALVRLGDQHGGAELLSTGQRNALCLAAFLPRTMRSENQFKFLVLDDPVQAFDGGRVRYIATVLTEIAQHYQVIVLTHDERLHNELRSSGVKFTRIELERSHDSAVSVAVVESPARTLVEDAEAIARTQHQGQLDDQALAIAVLSLCRQAIDEALSATYRRLRSQRPELSSHPDELAGHRTRERWTNLSDALLVTGHPAVPCTDNPLINLVNNGAHFNPPADCTVSARTAWVERTANVVATIESAGDMSAKGTP